MSVTLKQLRALITVARAGSFTRAAERLFISQSTLSGLIKELEQSLDLQLVNRSTRRLELSDVGRELYPLIDKTLQDLDGILDEAKKIKNLKKGVVRVAVPQLMACTLLPSVIAEFQTAYPDISIQLHDTMIESVIPRVLSGAVDFGIGPDREQRAEVASHLLVNLPFMAALRHDHPLAAQKMVLWSDLAHYPVIALRGQFTERLSLELQQAARNVTPYTEVTFMSTAISMVHANLGISVCIPYAKSLVEQYGLCMLPIKDPVVKRDFYVFCRKGHTLSPAAQTFYSYLETYIQYWVQCL